MDGLNPASIIRFSFFRAFFSRVKNDVARSQDVQVRARSIRRYKCYTVRCVLFGHHHIKYLKLLLLAVQFNYDRICLFLGLLNLQLQLHRPDLLQTECAGAHLPLLGTPRASAAGDTASFFFLFLLSSFSFFLSLPPKIRIDEYGKQVAYISYRLDTLHYVYGL
jgi:hypothetical protein